MNQIYNTLNKIIIRIILVIFMCSIFFLLFWLFQREHSELTLNQCADTLRTKNEIPIEINARESITFILGEDNEIDNPYYAEAINYYMFNESGKTEYMVLECRSLLEVRNYLVQNPPANGQPWGLINLVSHGNQWLGLSVKVTPDSKRATTERIVEYVNNGALKCLPGSILDNKSELFIHGCGVGNNRQLIHTLAKAFGGNDTLPIVRASRLFEYYSSVKNNNAVIESQRYLAKAWFTVYKKGYKPNDQILTNRLREQYPYCQIDWAEALSRDQPRWAGDIYYYSFEIPVKWVIKFSDKDSLPDLSSKEKQLAWINSQSHIVEALDRIEIPTEKFNWWFRNIYVNNEDDTRSPAIWLKGYSTVLCVLKPLLTGNYRESGLNTPFSPPLNDDNYYYTYNEL